MVGRSLDHGLLDTTSGRANMFMWASGLSLLVPMNESVRKRALSLDAVLPLLLLLLLLLVI